jgi:cell shape-determining protein MreC
LLTQVNNMQSITSAFTESTKKQTDTLNSALEDVKQLKAEQIKLSKQLEETSMALTEKAAIIETLETEKKRLTEEKADLQTRYDKMLAGGAGMASSAPVTLEKGSATAMLASSQTSALKGQVIEVDPKNTMATISIGSADGVKDGMKFHVTRGDSFICDILIIDVDADKAVGVLELVQQPPKVGDTASTTL